MSKETLVYRLYGAHDALLYVGITDNLDNRLSQHADKHWWRLFRRAETEAFPNRSAAKAEETRLIKSLRPKFNIAENQPGKSRAPQPPVSMEDRAWLTVKQAGEHLSVSEKTIRRMIARGELKAYRFGRRIRIDVVDLDLTGQLINPHMVEMNQIDRELAEARS